MSGGGRDAGLPPADSIDLLEGLLLRHAHDRPDAPAVVAHDGEFSYRELEERAAAIASGLAGCGVAPGDRVAIRLGNTGGFVAAALGCVWVGASFVPVSPEDPEQRVGRIVGGCSPKIMLSDDPVGVALPPGTAVVGSRRILEVAGPPRVPVVAAADLDAYIIYTSGTTGAPKGVRVGRPAFAWAVTTTADSIGLHRDTRTLCVSSFHFDGSYGSLFSTLWAGGTVTIPRPAELVFIKRFFRSLRESGITHTSFSPSYLRLLLRSPQAPSLGQSRLTTLCLGGEECQAEDLRRLWEVHPTLRVFNWYGPTETTIQVTSHEVDREAIRGGRVPIGRPHPGVSFHVEGSEGCIVTEAEAVGELHIGGRQLMTGYWGDDQLTAQVLSDRLLPGTLLYKTGDHVRREADGRYYYLGRVDDVIKRQGVRISLAEVSRALQSATDARAAVCLAVDMEGRLGIAAFAETDSDVGPEKLRALLGRELPATMIPDRFFTTKAPLPLNHAGKIDRAAVLARFGCTAWRGQAPGAGGG